MRILHVMPTANPQGGGPVEGVKQRSAELAKHGHSVEVVTLDNPKSEWLATYPSPISAVGTGGSGFAYSAHLYKWLLANVHRFEGLVINGLWQYHGFAARRAFKKLGRPYVVFTHGMLDPWFKTAYPIKHLKKSSYWLWGEYPVLRDAGAVLFTSQDEMVRARESFAPYQINERVVAYGTAGPQGHAEELRRAFLDRYPALRGKRILLFLGRIHPKKGCDILIEAFAQVAPTHPDIVLVVAGPDQVEWLPELKRLAVALKIEDRVLWPGMLMGDLKWGAFYSSEAFVLPSHQENFGIAVVEALSCGVPVLISDKVNIWREVQENGSGLVGPDTVVGTTTLLLSWLSLSLSERVAKSKLALDCFRSRFTITRSAEGLVDVLREVNSFV